MRLSLILHTFTLTLALLVLTSTLQGATGLRSVRHLLQAPIVDEPSNTVGNPTDSFTPVDGDDSTIPSPPQLPDSGASNTTLPTPQPDTGDTDSGSVDGSSSTASSLPSTPDSGNSSSACTACRVSSRPLNGCGAVAPLQLSTTAGLECTTLQQAVELMLIHTLSSTCGTVVSSFLCSTEQSLSTCGASLPVDFAHSCDAAVACLDGVGKSLATSEKMCTLLSAQFVGGQQTQNDTLPTSSTGTTTGTSGSTGITPIVPTLPIPSNTNSAQRLLVHSGAAIACIITLSLLDLVRRV